MELYNLNSVYPLVETLYGVEVKEEDFEDIAMVAWELINNKHTRLYRYVADTVDQAIELPCNVDIVESVHVPINDAQMTSNKTVFNSIETLFVEGYIDAWNSPKSPFSQRGKLVKYKEGNNTLYFDRDYKDVMIVYHGIIVDDETGLPLINDKEQKAIAAYIAYVTLFKEGVRKRDVGAMNIASGLKAEWYQKCNSARIPEHISQNDMDAILDVRTRWDRKQYGKSLKPII